MRLPRRRRLAAVAGVGVRAAGGVVIMIKSQEAKITEMIRKLCHGGYEIRVRLDVAYHQRTNAHPVYAVDVYDEHKNYIVTAKDYNLIDAVLDVYTQVPGF